MAHPLQTRLHRRQRPTRSQTDRYPVSLTYDGDTERGKARSASAGGYSGVRRTWHRINAVICSVTVLAPRKDSIRRLSRRTGGVEQIQVGAIFLGDQRKRQICSFAANHPALQGMHDSFEARQGQRDSEHAPSIHDLLLLRKLSPGTRPDPGSNPRWRRAVRRAALDYRTLYTLRHTYTFLMLSAGKPLPWVADQLGHVGVRKIDEIYGRWTKKTRHKLLGEQLDLNQFFKAIRSLPPRAAKNPPNEPQIVGREPCALKNNST